MGAKIAGYASDPPTACNPGVSMIVDNRVGAPVATGVFAGHEGELATCLGREADGTPIFVFGPGEGLTVENAMDGSFLRRAPDGIWRSG